MNTIKIRGVLSGVWIMYAGVQMCPISRRGGRSTEVPSSPMNISTHEDSGTQDFSTESFLSAIDHQWISISSEKEAHIQCPSFSRKDIQQCDLPWLSKRVHNGFPNATLNDCLGICGSSLGLSQSVVARQ